MRGDSDDLSYTVSSGVACSGGQQQGQNLAALLDFYSHFLSVAKSYMT